MRSHTDRTLGSSYTLNPYVDSSRRSRADDSSNGMKHKSIDGLCARMLLRKATSSSRTASLAKKWLCRVEEERGDVQDRRRQMRAAPFVVALAEKSIAPFPLPAHRTGRDYFSHPALGRVSHGGMHRRPTIDRVERHHAQFPEHALRRELPAARPADLMPAAEKVADRVVEVELHHVPRLRHRTVAEVGRPSPHGAVQSAHHLLPRPLIAGPQSSTNLFPT